MCSRCPDAARRVGGVVLAFALFVAISAGVVGRATCASVPTRTTYPIRAAVSPGLKTALPRWSLPS